MTTVKPIRRIKGIKRRRLVFDIVIQLGGKVHGSQRERGIKTGLLDLLVYYEVPEGKRDKVKTRFEFIKNKSGRVIIQNQ